ncbi:protein-methionine-sulfoxide reductase catalytic subunit MsrP [Sedimenticola sp.]|uniref:protein-methionine-sulfoxide reductase catalytic subunit MsrP n=1 Tax=Sedimenticola sp. TaxID=1940285 RepID=UPI00258C75C9|nr:protein-methionine-sulfoxide reductase catalytic subunit MsrP [Sedimenticola sp.]MCW8905020.1 protein-methionine-sulfoxide reductase catalytic subunit MsrP [Sedimenticola sp.]
MLIKKPETIKPSEITDQAIYLNRRQFIRDSGLLGIGVASALAGLPWVKNSWAEGATRQPFPGRIQSPFSSAEKLTDFDDASSYNNFYEFGTRKSDPKEHAHAFVPRPWSVVVDGACEKPGTYDLEDFLRPHTLEERIYRLRCVEAWSMVIPWVGFSLGDALKRFQPTSRAKYVAFYTLHDPERMPGQKRRVLEWPYREGLRMDEAMHPLAILAVGMYGAELPNQNGAPLRLVVPWKYGFKSIKSIVRISFTEEQPVCTWNQVQPSEYGFYSNVNPNVDHLRWSQKKERRIGNWLKQETLMFNGYADQVASLYSGMDLKKYF